jgi:hypothetical protein
VTKTATAIGDHADPENAVSRDGGRARRFHFELPVQYRPLGEKAWHEGRMENISRSGVLFRAPDVLDVDTEVELSFVLPVSSAPPAIVCRGRVVRTVLPGGDGRRPGLAVTIARYRFQRGRYSAA